MEKKQTGSLFISMEGPDGSGKSTQIQLLFQYLKAKGRDIVVVREPGGTPISEKIRDIILDKQNKEMTCTTEALLYAASRAQLVGQVIKPALEKGKTVICDRFIDSSLAYQGVARNIGIENILRINQFAVDGVKPDITIFFDIPPQKAMARKTDEADRLECEHLEFHQQVYRGYLKIAGMFPERIKVIDADRQVEQVFSDVIDVLNLT
ncbi:MAG: dTMP kinase [Clostridia bacterium]|nr:dTMP kinase [Clostridia bacterium]